MKFLNVFNLRTFIILLISQLAVYLSIKFNIRFDLNLTLFGLAIGFPLGFSIQSAFRRRDKALEYYSLFKAGSQSLYNTFQISDDLPQAKKIEAKNMLTELVDQLATQLTTRNGNYASFQPKVNSVVKFMDTNKEQLSKRNIIRIVRYLRDVSESSVYLISLINHRTMVGLRFYAVTFIAVFPLVQAPMLLSRLDGVTTEWMIYALVGLSSLLLVTLSNFQSLIEYPFDEKGLDNIHVGQFSISF